MMLSALFLFLLTGCTGTPDTSGEDTSPVTTSCTDVAPSMSIGTGERVFEPLAEDDAVVMVHGPQGGWHMLGSARVNNTDSIVRIKFTIEVAETGVIISDNTYTVQMIMDEECSGYYPGMYGYIDVAPIMDGEADTPPELLSGVPVIMRMTATDLDGLTASAVLQITAAPDPVDVEDVDTGTGIGG